MENDLLLSLICHRLSLREQRLVRNLLSEGQSLTPVFADSDVRKRLLGCIEMEPLLLRAEQEVRIWREEGISLLALTDRAYPSLLRNIYEPPFILFSRGALRDEVFRTPMVGVVGSRNCDSSGFEMAREFGFRLAERGVCVVSGLALGVDAAAHRGALQAGASVPTIAVLGCGLRTIYPPSNRELSQEILEAGGLLLSAYEPQEKPYPANFLARNRIIAGVSLGVLVVQAAKRSGALSTARFALEEGRDVFAIPGSPLDSRHEGTNALIRQGAHLVVSPSQLLEFLPVQIPPLDVGEGQQKEHPIVRYLKESGVTPLSHLMEKFSDIDDIHSALIRLELEGRIAREGGDSYRAALRDLL
jgi:DNA processing protein